MGCTDSRVIETSKKNGNKPSTPTKDRESVTVKDLFDTLLAPPDSHDTPYAQPQLSEFYVEQNVTFDQQNVGDSVWNTKISVDNGAKKLKEQNRKKGSSDTEQTWPYRKGPNKKYVEPDNSVTINIEYDQASKKKQVVVAGGLYLGSKAACSPSIFDQVDAETTHSLVLLGNLFDMQSIDPFHQVPTDITQIEKILSEFEPVLSKLRQLAEEINVYYMMGSHDFDLTRVAMERLLGDRIKHIHQRYLILNVKAGNENYRVRLTSGQHWDFFNDKSLPAEKLLLGQPIGYYLSRAAVQNPNFSESTLMKPVVAAIPADLSKTFLQEIGKRPLQDRITGRMLLSAFGMSKPEDLSSIKCVVDEGKYISSQTIQEYPYIKHLLEQHGAETLMSMFQAMAGDYNTIASGFGEDVFISGLGDEASLGKVMTSSTQAIICAGVGTCSRRSKTMTTLKIMYPRQGSNGKVEMVSHKLDAATSDQNGIKKTETISQDKDDTISVESL